MAIGGISPHGGGEGKHSASLWSALAVLGFATLSWVLTRPPRVAGIHDSDSALFVVESISLSQTSFLDARPEWNTLLRVAAMPWGGLHIVLLKLGLRWAGLPSEACLFRAVGLYRFWSLVAVAAVVLAGALGYFLRGASGAVWTSGLVAVGVPHVGMYTQFNQVGTTALFSSMLLLAGAWRVFEPARVSAAAALGLLSFLYPFADNLATVMWIAFPAYLWLLLPHPNGRSFVRAIAPFGFGTGLAAAAMAILIGLRFFTGATVYDCPLLHLAGRARLLLSHSASSTTTAASRMTPGDLIASLGVGGLLIVVLAGVYGVGWIRARRDLCLVPVALAYTLPLLLVPRDVTMVTEYFRHSLNLVLLTSAIILARLWSPAGRGARWAAATRVVTVGCFILMLASARTASGAARHAMAGEAWSPLGARLARLPMDVVVASTAEGEVGILYAGRRILTQNDTTAQDLAPSFGDWPGRIDYLVIRPTEREPFADLIDRRHLELIEEISSGRGDRWSLFGLHGSTLPPEADLGRDAHPACRRQSYIPYSFDAGWRYASDSILRVWGTAGLLLGDRQLWEEWSRATRLPYEPFAGPGAIAPPATGPAHVVTQ